MVESWLLSKQQFEAAVEDLAHLGRDGSLIFFASTKVDSVRSSQLMG